MVKKTTISVIKADVGGWPGHATVHPELKDISRNILKKDGVKKNIIKDFYVANCGDDLELIMSHTQGEDSNKVHELAWKVFQATTKRAKELKLYGAGQDILSDAFSGNVRGMGPGVAEMEFTERVAEPIVVFMMDKTEPGAFNLPVFRIFADPFNTAGLVIDPGCHDGFRFEIWDIKDQKKVIMDSPEEMYDILALIGAKERYVIKRVFPKKIHPKLGDKLMNEPVAAISTEKLFEIAGEYVGKDDPVGIVRSQSGLPAFGEVLEPFGFPHLVSGWMRGSHNGPLMPVAEADAACTRFDGPPRVVALGFQINNATLVGPVDLFKDKAFDITRDRAQRVMDYMRRHGPFEPHRLPLADMEYTTLPKVMIKLKTRFNKIK